MNGSRTNQPPRLTLSDSSEAVLTDSFNRTNSRVPIEFVLAPRPGGIQGRRPGIRIRTVVEGIVRVRDP